MNITRPLVIAVFASAFVQACSGTKSNGGTSAGSTGTAGGGSSSGTSASSGSGASSGGTASSGDGSSSGASSGDGSSSDGGSSSGTSSDSGSSSGAAPTFADLTVTWTLQSVAGSEVSCDSTYNKAQISAAALDSTLLNPTSADPYTKLVDCGTGTATIHLQTSGDDDSRVGSFDNTDLNGHYRVTLQMTEATGQTINFWNSLDVDVDLSTGNKTIAVTLYSDGGYLFYNWGLTDHTGANQISCAQANIQFVAVTVTNGDTATTSTDAFPCDNDPGIELTGANVSGGGISSALLAGSNYTVTMTAIRGSSSGTAEGTADDVGSDTLEVPTRNGIDETVAETGHIQVTDH